MYADPTMFDEAEWRGDPRQRLRMSVAVAAVIVALLLSFFRMPDMPAIAPIGELLVNIVRDDAVEETVVEPLVDPVVEPAPPLSEPAATTASSASSAEAADEERDWTDWDQVISDTVAEMAAQPQETTYSINPRLERLREEARVKFRPSEAPVERPIWENVEKDILGRTILRSGNCYKVLDDPNVGSREEFEVFGQYIAVCSFVKREPQELPWVDEINDRRGGLSRYAHPSAE